MAPQVNDHDLVELALRGLGPMYVADTHEFVQTLRGVSSLSGPLLVGEGTNLRYAAISALGLALTDVDRQAEVLAGGSVAELLDHVRSRAAQDRDPGAVALAAWAAAEVLHVVDDRLFARMRSWLDTGEPLPVVVLAWMLSACVEASRVGSQDLVVRLRDDLADRLLRCQGPEEIFPHVDPASSQSRLRQHVSCFADQVYPVQALARLAGSTGRANVASAANRCAARICALQGPAGQWWWHYDVRDGSVVEGFPVYSVHQHAMGPMALLDLASNGGDDHAPALDRGLAWLTTHPEVFDELVDPARSVIWRKVGRREPPKAARTLGAVTTAVRPGLHLPGIDSAFPTNVVDRECRPYELGWLLYAWLRPSGTSYA